MRRFAVPVDFRPASWMTPNGPIAFLPMGKKTWNGYMPNPVRWSAKDTLAARLFVGFNVGEKTVYGMDDVVEIVKRVRKQQTGDPSSSFIHQRGIYRHDDGVVVEEPGAQIILINMGEKPELFLSRMQELAEIIADELEQEEVVVEVQHNGIVQEVLGIGAFEQAP